MHASMKRLHEVSGIERKIDIARQLNVSPSTVTNWTARGVSKEGALAAAEIYNADANYILDGSIERAPVKSVNELNLDSLTPDELVSLMDKLRADAQRVIDKFKKLIEFEIIGRSMSPEFNAGEYAYIDTHFSTSDLKDGSFVLAENTDGVKQLKQLIIKSGIDDAYLTELNKDFAGNQIDPVNKYNLVGLVKGKAKTY